MADDITNGRRVTARVYSRLATLKRAFHKWQEWLESKRQRERQNIRAFANVYKWTSRRVWNQWRKFVESHDLRMAAAQKRLQKLQEALLFRRKHASKEVISRWRLYVARQKHYRAAQQDFQQKRNTRIRQSVVVIWRQAALLRRQNWILLMCANEMWMRNVRLRVLANWKQYITGVRKQRALVEYCTVRRYQRNVSKVLQAWKSFAAKQKRFSQILHIASGIRRQDAMRRLFRQWRINAAEAKHQNEMLAKADSHWTAHTKTAALKCWKRYVVKKRYVHSQNEIVDAHYGAVLLERMFAAWQRYVTSLSSSHMVDLSICSKQSDSRNTII